VSASIRAGGIIANQELPGRVLRFVSPLITAFVVDLALGEEPSAVDLNQLILVVAEAVKDAATLGIVVGVVEPVGTARRRIAIDFKS
jgi:hypothetical protein